MQEAAAKDGGFTHNSAIGEAFRDRTLEPYAGLLFPPEGFQSGRTLGGLRLLWYREIDPDATAEIVDTMENASNQAGPYSLPFTPKRTSGAPPAKHCTSLVFNEMISPAAGSYQRRPSIMKTRGSRAT
ncbi:hypothetical protein MAF45_01045 [Mesosutterella sp. OilRF-GAM-744-9]|uniref:Uncharacterized protein n=1 Tax=Mesosutterella porci TaxID=2915351 RepID=A0ABS9MN42_9BURK|nr:hypothetical protein [Mesosutterella sp. oilRF-744-WT-GAM-9]MCG5030041.1 hypothetical protein [Mesosutterella sp. oilRF-744-WT-GAM-9]